MSEELTFTKLCDSDPACYDKAVATTDETLKGLMAAHGLLPRERPRLTMVFFQPEMPTRKNILAGDILYLSTADEFYVYANRVWKKTLV
jgi:hypothetical protein